MAKFGELISSEIPVLIDFYAEWEEEKSDDVHDILRDVAAALGDKAKVIKPFSHKCFDLFDQGF